eukprot:m.153646 g.153646  ORF g.153646 m.153646 type:complete len:59 (+) comp38624_c0_seq1:202-378(+)
MHVCKRKGGKLFMRLGVASGKDLAGISCKCLKVIKATQTSGSSQAISSAYAYTYTRIH